MKDEQEMAFPMDRYGNQGITLRDWFAGQAIAGFCTDHWNPGKSTEKVLAKLAYEVADAMMEARKRPE